MKKLIFMTFLFIGISSQAQDKKKFDQPTVVEASCGECQFGMKGKSCDLAVRIDGKSYFVEGTKIDQHGDAHAKDGFCDRNQKSFCYRANQRKQIYRYFFHFNRR
ncbi:DUF6370 family protein [Flavobacterium sp. P21]|uniref:DUF6370 family protein n=1 Tax=Flavobacterium sp. P21 TaxID=3423948 RepID=UPI003D67BA80